MKCKNHHTQKEKNTRTAALVTFGICGWLMTLLVGCTTLARSIFPPEQMYRTYEISYSLDGFYYAYCSEFTIFNNCKKMSEIKISFDDKAKLKELRDQDFVLTKRDKPF